MTEAIRVRGARQNNLKGLDLDISRRALTVITGPSGSGKSSLALDTLFAEGQRRYVESLSTYAKQFLERMEKPLVDSVEGVPPAVAIEQANPAKSSRSTVGTATEVYDYLRLLFARVGRTHCPECDRRVTPDTVATVMEAIGTLKTKTRIMVTFPLVASDQVKHERIVENLRALGFMRVLVGGATLDLADPGALDPKTAGADLVRAGAIHPGRMGADPDADEQALVVVDRLTAGSADRDRLADSIATAFREGDGDVVIVEQGGSRHRFSERFRCPDHPLVRFEVPTPKLFSFNSPYGSCTHCTGFGATLEYDPDLIVPNPNKTVNTGAVDPWSKPRYRKERRALREFTEASDLSIRTPWKDLPQDFRDTVLHGGEGFDGLIPFLISREKKKYKQYIRVFLRQYQTPRTCPRCEGARLRREALQVRVSDTVISQVADFPLDDLKVWLGALDLAPMETEVATTILDELNARVGFLVDVGLGYLTLARQMRTLSGGEAQRITLANALGSRLVDTLYVLDEPTVGLHPADTRAMLGLLTRLRDGGNTVVVVEHDTEAILSADEVVELGPASGEHGGELVFQGSPRKLLKSETLTGLYLSGREAVRIPRRRRVDREFLELSGASLHNVHDVDIEIPLGAMTVVTGVSGSGKSTLIHDILYRALEVEIGGGVTSAKRHLGEPVGSFEELRGQHRIKEVVRVDQSPIGRTPRSNPVTYVKAWSEVRNAFAREPLAQERGMSPRYFSFNVPGGRCEACKGAGQVEVEMVFMADVYLTCEACSGKRFQRDTLDVKVRGLSVADVLNLTVDQAIRIFIKEDKLGQALWHLQQVGLGYLRLGQPAPTLSGGEAQRLKIARELATAGRRKKGRRRKGSKLYLLDEPTTGLSGHDVKRLLGVLGKLLDAGHTVVVVEHNLDVIKSADWIIDMGPGAGDRGGAVVAMGTPEEVVEVAESVTGRFLAPLLAVEEPAAVG